MITNLQKALAVTLVAFGMPAWANHDQSGGFQPQVRPLDDNAKYAYARVIEVKPVTEIIRVPREQQVCRKERVQHRVAEQRSPGPVIFGAILGGVIGNELGHGHGRRYGHGYGPGYRYGHGGHSNKAATTIAGAVIGGAVASSVQQNRYPPKYYTTLENTCYQETRWQNKEQIVAWDVSYEYQGNVYHSQMDEPPGDTIPVRVSVDPANP